MLPGGGPWPPDPPMGGLIIPGGGIGGLIGGIPARIGGLIPPKGGRGGMPPEAEPLSP